MIKLMLNNRKPSNFAFFCPVSKLHLTASNPVGNADRVTPAILRGLKCGILVDVEGVVDITSGTVKGPKVESVQKTVETKVETGTVEVNDDKLAEGVEVETISAEVKEVKESKSKKKSKKASETTEE